MKGLDPVSRPRVPLRQDLGSQPLRDGMPGQGRSHRLPGLWPLGLASAPTCVRHLVGPIDHGQEALVPPLPPLGR
jgi:hypothetical protein